MSFGQYAFAKPVHGHLIRANPFGKVFYVSNTTNPGEAQGSPGPTRQGESPKNPFTTIAAAISAAVSGRGDTIVVQRGGYTENLTVNKAGLTIMGAVPYGYPDHVVITGRTVVSAANCSFYNLEFFSNSATLPSVRLGSLDDAAGTVASTWFEHCSFASDGTTEPEAGLVIFGADRTTVKSCYFVDNTFGILIRPSANAFPDQTRIHDCYFSENTTAHIGDGPFTGLDSSITTDVFGAANTRSGVGTNFELIRCVLGAGNVTPTDIINISTLGTSNGVMAGNLMADATGDSGDVVIPTGILYMVNASEGGWSSARP